MVRKRERERERERMKSLEGKTNDSSTTTFVSLFLSPRFSKGPPLSPSFYTMNASALEEKPAASPVREAGGGNGDDAGGGPAETAAAAAVPASAETARRSERPKRNKKAPHSEEAPTKKKTGVSRARGAREAQRLVLEERGRRTFVRAFCVFCFCFVRRARRACYILIFALFFARKGGSEREMISIGEQRGKREREMNNSEV